MRAQQQLVKILTVILIPFCSCGKKDKEPAQSVSQSALIGQWNGTFKPKTNNNFGPSQRVLMNLQSDRKFSIENIAQTEQIARGRYTDMSRHRAIILDFEESSFQLVAKEGSSQDFRYELNETDLVMDGQSGEFLLAQGTPDSADAIAKQPKDEQSVLFGGDWVCRKTNSDSMILLNINGKQFRGQRKADQKRRVFFSGQVLRFSAKTDSVPAFLDVEIQSSNQNDLVGTQMRFKQTEDSRTELKALSRSGDEASDSTPCERAS